MTKGGNRDRGTSPERQNPSDVEAPGLQSHGALCQVGFADIQLMEGKAGAARHRLQVLRRGTAVFLFFFRQKVRMLSSLATG